MLFVRNTLIKKLVKVGEAAKTLDVFVISENGVFQSTGKLCFIEVTSQTQLESPAVAFRAISGVAVHVPYVLSAGWTTYVIVTESYGEEHTKL